MNGPQSTAIAHRTISIETKASQEGRKSRTFSVELLAWVVADGLWELGATSKERVHRPVFLAYAAPASAARAFQANLQTGRPACGDGLRFEVPRSAGFRYESAVCGDASLTLVYLPHVFSLQPPSTDGETLSFVCMPPTTWVEEQTAAIASSMGSEAREAAIAAYFVAYLDARTPLPIANDLRFHLELFRAARKQPWCLASSGYSSKPGGLFAEGLENIGFESPVLCNVAPAVFADFLAEQTARHLPKELPTEVLRYGTTRIDRSRRILPHSHAPAAQLSLFGGL